MKNLLCLPQKKWKIFSFVLFMLMVSVSVAAQVRIGYSIRIGNDPQHCHWFCFRPGWHV
jgi:hypothetical protein